MKRIFCFILAFVFVAGGLTFNFGQAVAAGVCKKESVYARGGIPIYTVKETISYDHKVEDEYFIPVKMPGYVSSYTCGITAGGNIVGYYDKMYENLIPNHTGKYLLGKWIWGGHGTEVTDMFTSVYNYMGATSAGVTIAGYKSGLASYTANKNLDISFTSVMNTNGTLNSAYKTALKGDTPLTIFLDGFNVVDFGGYLTYSGYDTLDTEIAVGCHVMAIYGYLEVKYYNSSNVNFQTETFLYVVTGFSVPKLAWLRISAYCTIDDCYISYIY